MMRANDEGRMSNDERMIEIRIQKQSAALSFHLIVSAFFRHSSFVIIDRYETVSVNLPMQLRRFSIVLAVLMMSAGFLLGQTQSGTETGIEGVITINARPGPVRADSPVSPLANTAFAVETQKGEIASFTTDNEGRFRVSLAPGHYKVSRKGRTSSIGRYGPFEVDVVAGQMTKVQWECDSGMR
jgi:hypothetical protein